MPFTWKAIPEGTRERRTQRTPRPMCTLGLQARSNVERSPRLASLTQHVHHVVRHPCRLAILVQNFHVSAYQERGYHPGPFWESGIDKIVCRHRHVPALEQHRVGPQLEQILRGRKHIFERRNGGW